MYMIEAGGRHVKEEWAPELNRASGVVEEQIRLGFGQVMEDNRPGGQSMR